MKTRGLRIRVQGVVQGVGFRPFVYRLAKRFGLTGSVRNTGEGVLIEAFGDEKALLAFLKALKEETPPLARIESLKTTPLEGKVPSEFLVLESQGGTKKTKIPPDVATCEACLAELFDPKDRRFRYPFINCTDCGPRFSVILDLPYDRAKTTMKVFPLCPECQSEYQNPEDRRFHAEPNACPVCGPKMWLCDAKGNALGVKDPLTFAIEALREGKILALRGLGGFHLACDATNNSACKTLRARKNRPRKPFAIMVKDLAAAELLAELGPEEKRLLGSPKRPILLAKAKRPSPLADEIAPGFDILGLMLPYTPLHHLLLREGNFLALVMTSGNLSGEPLCVSNEEALTRLKGIADFFLLHNREIAIGIDDSVMRFIARKPRLIRRARGFVPEPLPYPLAEKRVFAFGPHLKNTFTLTREDEAFISQHIGDLEDLETVRFFEKVRRHFENILHVRPQVLVCDLHPGYLSTQMAEEETQRTGLPLLKVQHHVAHAAAVAGEFGIRPPFLALILDGVGLGDDHTLWGGELFYVEAGAYHRLGHIFPIRQPGGDVAAREPWRMLLAYLYALYGDKALETFRKLLPETFWAKGEIVFKMLARGINAPFTTSTGRLFDTCAALLGICYEQSFEGEAPMLLEALAARAREKLIFDVPLTIKEHLVLGTRRLFQLLLENLKKYDQETLALGFHLSLARGFAQLVRSAVQQTGLKRIVLSGGCFQNKILTEELIKLLEDKYEVYFPEKFPPNDGAVSYGQAIWASWKLNLKD